MRDHIVRSLVAGAAALAFLIPAFGGRVDAAAPPVDNSIYAELLTKYVANGYVNYAGFKRDETRLDQYLAVLEQVDPERLPREEQFAFYIGDLRLEKLPAAHPRAVSRSVSGCPTGPVDP